MNAPANIGKFGRGHRRSGLTAFARRLTPIEVAQHWFRRGAEYSRQFHADYPDFPKAGPDGLYLASAVELWFETWHGHKPQGGEPVDLRKAEEQAMRAARGE